MACVYRHIRLDKNVPFYIGKAVNKYRAKTSYGRNSIWTRIAKKSGYQVEILFDDVSMSFACQKEIEFIKMYGRINIGTGTLANMTDGGDGGLGRIITQEEIAKRIKKTTGKKRSKEVKLKMSQSAIGKNLGKKHTEEHTRKISEKLKGRVLPPITEETRQKLRLSHLGVKHTEERKKNMSLAHQKRLNLNKS